MDTPFGELRIVDAHAHFFSHHLFEVLGSQLPEAPTAERLYEVLGAKLPLEFPSQDPASLGKRWVEELDRNGIARSVMIASVPGDEGSVGAAHKAHPGRIIPYFMLNPKAPDAVERTKRALDELECRGICLFPAMHHFYVWEKELYPIFELAAESGTVVFVHCGLLKLGIRDKLGLKSPFDMRYASPLEVSGVARTFDTIPFVIPHFGAGFFRELLLVAAECGNVYTDTSSSNAWMEKLPEPLTLRRVFERALAVLGPDRILYGSDSSFFPRGYVKERLTHQLEVASEIGLSAEDAARLFGGNLQRLVD